MIVPLLFLAATTLGDLSGYPEAERYGALPHDARVLIDRRLQCNHWHGEDAYDRDRKRQIDEAVRDLRCDTVEREERRLRHRYSNSPPILKALAETRDWH